MILPVTPESASVAEQAKMVQRIASEHGGTDFSWTAKPEDRDKLWRARHDVAYADKALREGGQLWVTDVCVPISRLGRMHHGNFHIVFVLNPSDPKEMAEAERLNKRVVHRALSLDGTCTGEHGIGCGKINFLLAEHGEAVRLMLAIKRAIDPHNIMNPGKILLI
jgi:D-lactate dehydrogenase (cytochrome)